MGRTYHVLPHLRTVITVAVLAGASGTSHADGYRLPVTLTDLVGGGAFAAGVQLDVETTPGLVLAIGGLTVGALGAPVLHGAEGNYGRMTASIILRATLPTIGAYLGKTFAQDSYKKFRSGGGLLGAMAGFAVVTIVDIAMASTPDQTKNKRVFSVGGSF